MYKVFLFDLDGTIINSEQGVTRCADYALKSFGIEEKNFDNLRRFIGPPLIHSFTKFYGFTQEQAIEGVKKFRERFTEKGVYEYELYDGITDCLKTLKFQGKTIALVTSKYDVFAKQIVKDSKIDEYFSLLVGTNATETFSDKSELIEFAVKKLGALKSETVMVGDTGFDIIGAKTAGVSSIGAAYGFPIGNELYDDGADYVVNSAKELNNLFKKM